MWRHTIAGPLQVEPIEGGDEGDRLIVVAPAAGERVEIPLSTELIEQYLVPRLTMTDEELVEALKGENEEAEVEMRRQRAAALLAPDNGRPQG